MADLATHESAISSNAKIPPASLSGRAAILGAYVIAAIIGAVTVAQTFGWPPRFKIRLLHHAFDMGHFVALGLVSAGLCGVFQRLPVRKRRGLFAFALIFLVSGILGALVLPIDLQNLSGRLAGTRGASVASALLIALVTGIAFLVPMAWGLGRVLSRRYLRWLGAIAGGWLVAAHPMFLQRDYFGLHLFVVLIGTSLGAASLTGAVFPKKLALLLARFPHPRLRTVALALASLLASASLFVPPSPSVAMALVRSDGSVLAHFLLRLLHPPRPLRTAEIPAEMRPWFQDRKNLPPVLPSEPRLSPDPLLVVLLTIDCARADVVMSGKYDEQLRWLARIRQASTTFSNARSTSSGTVASLSSIFLGTHYSQQYWTKYESTTAPYLDDTVRMQEILTPAGIRTVTFAGAPGLVPAYGILRNFTESTFLAQPPAYAAAETLTAAALERLRKLDDKPVFLYLHFLDAHAPYNRGLQTGPPFDRYLSELAMVDAQIGKLAWQVQGSAFNNRAVVIITADHGEAFGEHGMFHHSSTVYDELLRVPLMIWRPGHQGFGVDEPVSLIDLGPTILDLYGLPTPAHFMGQSLVPFLRGEKPRLTRPILAEAQLKQALILPDGHKVIVDNRLNTVELYDLNTDPGENNSLADDEERLAGPLSLVRQFFQVHTFRKPGYSPPYRVW